MYLLCKELCKRGIADAQGSDLFVVFISNDKKQACIFCSHVTQLAVCLKICVLFALFLMNLEFVLV